MTIGLKYWNVGESVPSSWTDLNVLAFYARPVRYQYDEAEAIDGGVESWRRKRYMATIEVGPLAMNTSAARTIVEAMQDKYYVRIKDTRFSYLGDTNTVNFIWPGSSEPEREEPSNATENIVLELKSEAVA